MVTLGDFRRNHAGATVDLATFREVLARSFVTHHKALWPLFETTEVPDFRIHSHGRGTGQRSNRYRVEVENRGPVAGSVEVVTLTAEGTRMRGTSLLIPPSDKRAVFFDRPGHIGRIALDPRGTTLQSDLSDQFVELTPGVPTPAELLVPSFGFHGGSHTGQEVKDFDLDLGDVSIVGFNGYLAPYRTYHGPSGAVLMGRGEVRIEPSGAFAAGFESALGQRSLSFFGVRDMWIRFPLSAWAEIEPLLGEEATENEDELFHRRNRVYQYMFNSYFADGARAQVPPPGSAVAIFIDEGDQWHGIVRHTLPTGRVEMRLWDHLQNKTIWEETH